MHKIGFILKFTNTYENKHMGVWGDEIVSLALCKALNKRDIIAEVCSLSDVEGKVPYDIAIHTSDIASSSALYRTGKRNFLWIQGFQYDNGKIESLDAVYDRTKNKYDKILTASKVLADKYNIPLLKPSVDLDLYHHVESPDNHEVSFIGNLIKPPEVDKKYIAPLGNFNYELYGGDLGKISHERGLEVMCGSKINLHFGFKETIEWDMIPVRPLHISACKAFTLSDEVPYMMEIYKDAIGFTKGGDDEIDKIKYYLEHEAERCIMANRAYEITKSMFSSDLIADKILEAL